MNGRLYVTHRRRSREPRVIRVCRGRVVVDDGEEERLAGGLVLVERRVAPLGSALVPRLLGGTVVTEAIFSWPGMGRLALEAAQGRDYPLITGLTVVVATIAVATSLIVDLAYTRIDPRVRLT